MSRKSIIIILGGVALLLLLLILGVVIITAIVGDSAVKDPEAVEGGMLATPDAVTILYTCDTRGHIEPCGCSSGMAGGIARRLSYLTTSRPKNSLLVDVGDVAAGARDWERLEFDYLLRGYAMMDYDAVNIGHREAMLSVDQLREFKAKYSNFISANLADTSGKLIFDPYRIIKLDSGSGAGIIGVLGSNYTASELGAGLMITPPAEALGKYLPELTKKSDFIVLLAFCDEEEIKSLADQFYEFDVIVGGKILQPTGEPMTYNKSTVVLITDKGKAIGRLELSRGDNNSWTSKNEIVRLEESMPADERIVNLVEDYKALLKEMDIQPHRDDEEGLTSITATRSANADRYIGSESCRDCHTKTYDSWQESKHAHAYHTLETKNQEYNPRCLQCHTVGYGSSDGYTNERLTPHLKDVSCETCHGRGDQHVKHYASAEASTAAPPMKSVNCVTCHDPDNSPKFEFESYWAKIAHGKD